MKLTFTLLTVLLITACSQVRLAVVNEANVSVFSTEQDSAYQNTFNRPKPEPITVLSRGDKLWVVEDTYGKDYWACKVRLSNQEMGWVLCTSLSFGGTG